MRKLALASLLLLAALPVFLSSAASSDSVSVGSGPFWYMRTLGTMRAPRCLKQRLVPPSNYALCEGTVWLEVGMSVETWVGKDGTARERMVEDWQRFASARDRARWLTSGKRVPVPISVAQGDGLDIGSGHFPSTMFGGICCEVPPMEGPPGATGGPVDVGDSVFTYRQLLSLPVSGRAAVRSIEQAETALRRRYARTLSRWHSPAARRLLRDDLTAPPKVGRSIQQLVLITQLLASPVPQSVRLALFHAALSLPGVRVNPDARDSLGRSGVSIAASAPHWDSVRFMFDSSSGELLTGVPMNGGPPDVSGRPSVVVAQGFVSSVTGLPAGVRAIRGVGAPPIWPSPPAPAMIAITPTVGGPRTVFKVTLPGAPGQRARPAPTVWLGVGPGSAGSGIYRGGQQVIDPCLPHLSARAWPSRTIQRGGRIFFIYRLRPSRHRGMWCRGRYQLGITVLPNPLPRRYTTPPYTGPSGTSAYFEVR